MDADTHGIERGDIVACSEVLMAAEGYRHTSSFSNCLLSE